MRKPRLGIWASMIVYPRIGYSEESSDLAILEEGVTMHDISMRQNEKSVKITKIGELGFL